MRVLWVQIDTGRGQHIVTHSGCRMSFPQLSKLILPWRRYAEGEQTPLARKNGWRTSASFTLGFAAATWTSCNSYDLWSFNAWLPVRGKRTLNGGHTHVLPWSPAHVQYSELVFFLLFIIRLNVAPQFKTFPKVVELYLFLSSLCSKCSSVCWLPVCLEKETLWEQRTYVKRTVLNTFHVN